MYVVQGAFVRAVSEIGGREIVGVVIRVLADGRPIVGYEAQIIGGRVVFAHESAAEVIEVLVPRDPSDMWAPVVPAPSLAQAQAQAQADAHPSNVQAQADAHPSDA